MTLHVTGCHADGTTRLNPTCAFLITRYSHLANMYQHGWTMARWVKRQT